MDIQYELDIDIFTDPYRVGGIRLYLYLNEI